MSLACWYCDRRYGGSRTLAKHMVQAHPEALGPSRVDKLVGVLFLVLPRRLSVWPVSPLVAFARALLPPAPARTARARGRGTAPRRSGAEAAKGEKVGWRSRGGPQRKIQSVRISPAPPSLPPLGPTAPA